MPLVTVKTKFQVTIPLEVRAKLGIDEGDLLEAEVENGRIVLTPKVIVDRDPVTDAAIREGLKDLEEGRVSPVFSSVEEMKQYLEDSDSQKV